MAVSSSPAADRRRWLAGAGAAAATLALPAWVRHARAQSGDDRFALGVSSGQPKPDGVVLWTRLMGRDLPATVPVRWDVAADEAFSRIVARGEEQALEAEAHSLHVEVSGLAPDRPYWYRFSALGQQSRSGRTRTAPAADAVVGKLDCVVASCQRWDAGHYAAWRDALDFEPDLVLFLGDYIYEYASRPDALRRHAGGLTTTLADYRLRHAEYKSDPHLQAAHAAAPWLLVWDDHEVDNDYAAFTGQSLQADFAAQRRAAYQAYWEHMPLPRSAKPKGDGSMPMFGRLDWGRLARLHTLDNRQHRDVQACPRPGRAGSNTLPLADCPDLLDPRRTLLGTAQERWLAEGWSLERPWNLLAQQTLLARFSWSEVDPAQPDSGTYWTDGWDGYPAARRRLLETVQQKKVPGLVVLGGDVHAHYVADVLANDHRPGAAVLGAEFCGTSISSNGLAQQRVSAARAFNPHVMHARSDQRGSLRLRVTPQRVEADLRVVADVRDAASAALSQARFVVEAGRPGPVPV
jgi:alkaline phosphatase D